MDDGWIQEITQETSDVRKLIGCGIFGNTWTV